ncbi:MAG: D-alanyl-D-alanine carboxypeptidase/D-alanyl-D-alanine-endopeptidase [Dysgonomonas sp.]
MRKIFIALFFLFSCFYQLTAQGSSVLENFIKSDALKNASVGICIRESTGKEILSYNQNAALTPASILKVVTTATALEVLGSDYRFKTDLSIDGNENGRLIIHGYGDPTLGSEHFFSDQYSFLDLWRDEVVKSVTDSISKIYVVDNYFGYQGVSSKWLREDMGNYFAAGAYGISVFDNTYRLYFNTMNTNAVPEITDTKPLMKDIRFINMLKYNTIGRDNGYIWGEPFSNERILTGSIPANRKSFSIKGDIPDPGMYLGQTFAEKLIGSNISVTDVETSRMDYLDNFPSNSGITNNNEKVFYTHYSPLLKDIVRVVNVKSNNHYAEHLIRAIGRSYDGDIYAEPLQAGIDSVNKYWLSKGLNTGALFMYDGCGLSPSNGVSASFMCDILVYMLNKSVNSQAFINSLPKAGQEGTVRNFLKGTKLEGKVFVKSGSIADVQCYSGYYINDSKKYVFTIITNRMKKDSRREVVKAIENLLLNVF